MYIKREYGFWLTFNWSRKPFILGTIYSAAVCLMAYYFEIKMMLPRLILGIRLRSLAFRNGRYI